VDFGQLRELLARWARRQALIRRVHVVGGRARGVHQQDDALELVIELDARADLADDAGAIARWHGQLASALPMAVNIALFTASDRDQLREVLRAANICVYERPDSEFR